MLNFYQYYDGRFYPNNSADIQAGIGYWIYVANNTEIDVVGLPVPDGHPVEVPLKPGWNIIGNPFDQPLTWDDNISFKSGEEYVPLSRAAEVGVITGDIYRFDGAGYVGQNQGSILEPWKGYFIKASAECELILSR